MANWFLWFSDIQNGSIYVYHPMYYTYDCGVRAYGFCVDCTSWAGQLCT